MQRLQHIETWLKTLNPAHTFQLAPASADASFRRYFRASFSDGKTLIVMDAPPEHEDCRPFIHVAALLAEAGVNAPKVLAQDLERGFLLLTDLGGTTYLSVLDQDNATLLYRDACKALVKIQLTSKKDVLPDYNAALLTREMQLFPDWYIGKYLDVTLSPAQQAVLQGTFATLNANILAQGQVFVHRDYHSRNLMLCDQENQGQNPGILDFQDAVHGSISYDLVSLLKDAYIYWEEEQILDWAIRYWEDARKASLPVPADFADFYRDFEWMGAQRHIKVLGIFARLYYRDSKDGYLKDMPLVMKYLRKTCERYNELRPLLRLLDELEPKETTTGMSF
ncbi:MAG: aminoglycoside phosphotransferase family protein [Methylophilaceae bacterium]